MNAEPEESDVPWFMQDRGTDDESEGSVGEGNSELEEEELEEEEGDEEAGLDEQEPDMVCLDEDGCSLSDQLWHNKMN